MSLPLDGVKVLDFTAIMAGPYCTLMLSDMGADVTKIETFPEGDGSRVRLWTEDHEGWLTMQGVAELG